MNAYWGNEIFLLVLTYLVHSTILLGVAWVITSTRLAGRVGTRELIWRVALLGSLVTAPLHMSGVLAPFAGPVHLPQAQWITAQAESPVSMAAPSESPASLAAGAGEKATGAGPSWSVGASALDSPASGYPGGASAFPGAKGLALAGVLAWSAVVAALLYRLARMASGLRARLRGRNRVSDEEILDRVRNMAGELDLAVPKLSVKRELAGPFCLVTGEIVLPDWALSLSREQLDAMLVHEMAHLKRNDPWWVIFRRLIQAVAFFQPLNHVAARELDQIAEFACDAWAKKVCNTGLGLAECLVECIRRQTSPSTPGLVMAMASAQSPLVERTRKLLDGSSDDSRPATLAAKLLVVTGFLALGLLAPSFATGGKALAGEHDSASVEIHGSSGVSISNGKVTLRNVRYQVGNRQVNMEGRGRFTFNEEETDVVSISRGGFLDLEEQAEGVTRRVRFEADGDSIVRRFWRDGSEVGVDDDLRAWLTRVIPDFYRATGVDAKARVARIHERAGAGAVLDEMALLPGSYALRVYGSALVELTQLEDEESARFFDLVTVGSGSYDMREALTAYVANQHPSDREWNAFAGAAGEVPSSYDLRETLVAAARSFSGPDENWRALLSAASRIHSSYDLRVTLTDFSKFLPGNDETMRWVAQTAQGISSAYDLRETVSAYAGRGDYGAGGWLALLDASESITSGYDRYEALSSIASKMPRDAELVARYEAVAGGISSEYDRNRALKALN